MDAHRNIEIKARIKSLDQSRKTAQRLSGGKGEILLQTDTFFRCAVGRLKLREFEEGQAELIAYARADEAGPKLSEYHRIPVSEPARLKTALAGTLGICQVVRKRREVYLIDNVRIHLDDVEELGTYLEMEAVMDGAMPEEHAREQVDGLMGEFDISPADLIACAYADLVAQRLEG